MVVPPPPGLRDGLRRDPPVEGTGDRLGTGSEPVPGSDCSGRSPGQLDDEPRPADPPRDPVRTEAMDPVSHDPIRIAEQHIYRVRHPEGVDLARPDDHERLALTEAARAQ